MATKQSSKSGRGNRSEADIKALMAKSKADLAAEVQAIVKARKAKDDADFAAEDARSKTARAVAGTPAKKAPAKKAPVVTKEQLKKSGFTSLRDYMNAQQGLTRRDGKAPVMRSAAPAAKTAPKAPAKLERTRPALSINPAILRRQEADEQRRADRRAAPRSESPGMMSRLFGRNPKGTTPAEFRADQNPDPLKRR